MQPKKGDKQLGKDKSYQAFLSNSAKQWEDCIDDFTELFEHMRKYLPNVDLNQQEKNIFSSSYKHLLEKSRT